MNKWIAAHRKLVLFAVGAVVTVCVQIWGTDNPYVSLGILVATGLGVYQAPNTGPQQAPGKPAVKAVPPAA